MLDSGCTQHMIGYVKTFKQDMVVGVKDVIFDKNKLCSACQAGNQFTSSHPMKAYLSTSRCLELLHMHLFGPTTYKSLGGNLYCLVIVDDYSRYAWTFFSRGQEQNRPDLQDIHQASPKRVRVKCGQG